MPASPFEALHKRQPGLEYRLAVTDDFTKQDFFLSPHHTLQSLLGL